MLLASCASVPPLSIDVPASLRAACERPEVGDLSTIGDLAGFAIQEEAALAVCDTRREAVVAIVDAHNKAITPKPRWKP